MSAIIILILRFIAVLSLYIFLGLVLFTLWKDLGLKGSKDDLIIHSSFTIRNLSNDESFDFNENEIFIGRDDLSQIKLEHDEAVSNLHARIYRKARNIWIEDLQSTNGTFINGEKILTPVIIVSGDRIKCGQTTLEIILRTT